MTRFRKERDILGEKEIPADVLHGIHTARALENFPFHFRKVPSPLIRAFGAVKLACARVNHRLDRWNEEVFNAIESACREVMQGLFDDRIQVDALQGGAGTSTNLNINEILANRALQLLGQAPGEYHIIDPLEDINLHQSTNDTYPTALKIAAIQELKRLETSVIDLLEAFQQKEKEFARIVKVGRTEFQDAVLITLGREFGAYADALARDRWRIYKCEERLRVVNLGGTAIGTGLSAPRPFIFETVNELRAVTGLGIARAENLVDATQNMDAFAEVSGILKACAVNLFKIANDIRFLSSGPDAGIRELKLPQLQAGSSIMPGKINPVIPEAVAQITMLVMAHDQALTLACASGHLELNPFLPLVAYCLLTSIDLLASACSVLSSKCIRDLTADEEICRRHVDSSTATLTALIERIGYHKAVEIAERVRRENRPVRDVVLESGLMTAEEFSEWISPERVMRLGHPIENSNPEEQKN